MNSTFPTLGSITLKNQPSTFGNTSVHHSSSSKSYSSCTMRNCYALRQCTDRLHCGRLLRDRSSTASWTIYAKHNAVMRRPLIASHTTTLRTKNTLQCAAVPADQVQVLVSAVAEGSQDALLTTAAWALVAGATVASYWFMSKAFFEAKSVIDRRQEGEKLKEQEEKEKEEQRKRKIKEMFERL